MRDYQDMVHMTDRGRALLAEEPIEIVVLTTNRGGQSLAPLADHLDANPRWARVFANQAGVMWVRRMPAYEALCRQCSASVNPVSFATLERWTNDDLLFTPPTLKN